MARYLLIESRDPFESSDVASYGELAVQLRRAGDEVTVFLVENGVLPARAGARAEALARVVEAGIEVLADEFALRERGIPADRLRSGVRAAPLSVIVDRLADGSKTLWH
jgi:predicted peroxiredoxin